MPTVLIAAVIIFFLGMGLLGLAAPERITAIQGMPEQPTRFYPSWFYCTAETAMAVVLWAWA